MPGVDPIRGVPDAFVDFGLLAQQAAEKRLEILGELIDAEEEEYERVTATLDPPLQAPYCGCGTCDIRETLTAGYPFLLQAAREEVAGNRLA